MLVLSVADDVKKEPGLVGTEEEVTTSSIASSGNDIYDSVSWQKLSPGSITGLDLSDPRQLAEFSRYSLWYLMLTLSQQLLGILLLESHYCMYFAKIAL